MTSWSREEVSLESLYPLYFVLVVLMPLLLTTLAFLKPYMSPDLSAESPARSIALMAMLNNGFPLRNVLTCFLVVYTETGARQHGGCVEPNVSVFK